MDISTKVIEFLVSDEEKALELIKPARYIMKNLVDPILKNLF